MHYRPIWKFTRYMHILATIEWDEYLNAFIFINDNFKWRVRHLCYAIAWQPFVTQHLRVKWRHALCVTIVCYRLNRFDCFCSWFEIIRPNCLLLNNTDKTWPSRVQNTMHFAKCIESQEITEEDRISTKFTSASRTYTPETEIKGDVFQVSELLAVRSRLT